MTHIDRDTRFDQPLHTDDQLRSALQYLLRRANLPQLWVIFFGHDDRLTGPFMPGTGYPDDPLEIVQTGAAAGATAAQLLAAGIGTILDEEGAGSVVLVWERPGPDELTAEVRAWVREMALACRQCDVRLRRQLLLHDHGLRVLVPDDYI